MKNKLLMSFLLILFITSISCVSAEDNASSSVLTDNGSDIYVSPSGNDDNDGSVNKPVATIDKAINSTATNIHLSEGKFIGTGNNGITIENKTINIVGAGVDKTIIDLNGSQFINIKKSSSVVLTNLSIINGYAASGGAIYNEGNLTIQNSYFKNNSANYGGAVYNSNNMDVYSSDFEDNFVKENGGAIVSYGFVGIYDSDFVGNKATGAYGGSIYISGNNKNYSVLNRNKFKDTSASSYGGALYVSYTNVTNCIFENASTTSTSSSSGGGAIYGSNFILKNNTMTNCVAKSGNGNYIWSASGFNGVVTVLEGKTVDITSSTFMLNATITDDMGHPVHGGSYTFKFNDITIGSANSVNGFIEGTFSKLLDNGKYTVSVSSSALNNGAVIKTATANVNIDRDYVDYYVSPNGDDTTNDGSKDKPFKTINKAITEGFAKNNYVNVYLLEGTYSGTGNVNLALTNLGYLNLIGVSNKTIIDGNSKNYAFNFGTTLNVNVKNITFTNLYIKTTSGLIRGGSGDYVVNIDNCVFEKCNARYLVQVNGEVNNVIMKENVISSRFIANAVSINNLLFENNSGAGQISVSEGIYNSTFINNKITVSKNDYGIVYISNANFTSNNNVFENNTVKGLYINRGCANFTSINDTFISNVGVTGGAVKGGGTFINAKFINNTATNGGAIYHDTGALNLKNCIFENNKADDGDDIYGYIHPTMDYGLCLNTANTLTLVSTNSSNLKSELKAIFDLNGLKVSGYDIKFYLNGSYKGSVPLVNSVATFVAVSDDGKYEISASSDYINKTTVVKGILNVNANPASGFDVYVSEKGSDESGDGSLAKPFATIKKAFDYGMNQNALSLTIHLIGTLKGEGNVNLDLTPYVDLTIAGENKETSIIDAEKNKYVFDFVPMYDDVKVYLENLTIKNGVTGSYPSQGGGATVDVGLVRINGYYLNVNNCIFRNTTGHGISADKLFSTVVINNTKFIESSGGFYSSTKALNIAINNTEFINCNLCVNNNGKLTYLTGLIAVTDIFNPSSTNKLYHYNITQVMLDNVTFDGNYNGTTTVGSAFYLKGTNATVINSKFINQKDISAIHAFSDTSTECNVTIVNTYFENNTRDIDYGYGQASDYRPIFWLINSTFINSGAFACPDGRYQDAWWVVNNTKFINMTNPILFRGSISNKYEDAPLPEGVNNIITVINSLFLNNENGVSFIGGNITGSSFYNTTLTAVGNGYPIYLNNNFWNSSEPTYVYSSCIYCDTWLVPVLISDNASGSVQTIKLTYLAFNGTDYSYYDVSKVPFLDVNTTFSVSGGVISPNKGVLNASGLSADYTYNGVGNQVVTATLSDGNVLKLNVTFYKIDTFTNMTISNSNPQTGDYVTVNVVVRDKNGKLLNGSVNVYLNSVLKGSINLVNGAGSLDVLIEKIGACEIFANYTGDLENSYSSNMTIVTVKDTQMSVNVSDSTPVTNITFDVDFDHAANGYVFVTVNGTTYNATVSANKASVIVPPLAAGNYNAVVSYNGVVNKTVSFTVSADKNPVLDVSDVVMFYKDGTRLVAKLSDYLGNPIANATLYFTINGQTYTRSTDANGSASIALNLIANVYKATISYNGSDKYNAISKDITVTIKSTIDGQNIVKMYQNDTQFYATFLDTNGKALANKDVTFNINGVFYTRTTDSNGIAKLSINLRPGNYTLTAINTNEEQKGFNVLVKSLIEADDLSKYYQNASKFEAKIYNKDGSLAINKDVQFNINGVFYTRTTDSNGVASLGINLRPGDYSITTIYDGLSIGNNVNILPTLETSDLSMKFQDGSKFQAKTLDAQGNPLANQEVTFNVNGVFYHRTTGSDGVASLNINLMAGEYIITSMWNNFQTGNTIKINS